MTLFKKRERKIIILGTGPGGETCPFDRETWAVAKILMSGRPQWRLDRLFNLDDLHTMLSVIASHTKEALEEKLIKVEKESVGLVGQFKSNLEVLSNRPKDREGDQLQKNTAASVTSLTEGLHSALNDLTRVREGLEFQAKFKKEDFVKRINERKVPFIAQRFYPEIPLSKPYPLREVVNRFGTPYFTNTICYMIAMAIIEEVTHIQLWGIFQGGYQEYLRERKGVEYWLGLAAGFGIKVEVRGVSLLFTNDDEGRLYGYKKTYSDLLKEIP